MATILTLTQLADYSESGWRAYIGKSGGSPDDKYILLEKIVNTETAQTITALKTFDKDMVAMKGTSTGINTISVANASASDYTNTVPAKTGTFAMLDDVTNLVFTIAFAASALDADLVAAVSQAIIAAPEDMTITQVFAKVGTAPTGSTIVVDINVNSASILSTKLSIDATEKTSLTAATPVVISSSSLTQGDEIVIDIDQVGATITGKDLTIYILGTKA